MEREILFYAAGSSDAARYAARFLRQSGLAVTEESSQSVTHVLLDVPALCAALPDVLPADAILFGGGQVCAAGHPYIDLLLDPKYQADNARITAYCALQVASMHLTRTFYKLPVLILGWGRIGKCLGRLLRALGAQVSVAARNPADRAMLDALGYTAADPAACDLEKYRLVFNTVPAPLLTQAHPDCLMVELASGAFLPGPEVVSARGLPGRYAPEESGALIAETVLRLMKEGQK